MFSFDSNGKVININDKLSDSYKKLLQEKTLNESTLKRVQTALKNIT